MKALYYFVTFVASLMVIAFVGWNLYVQWPVIEKTLRNAVPKVAPAAKKCDCGPNCPKGGCENCTCKKNEKECCPGH